MIWFPLLIWTCFATAIYLSLRGVQSLDPRFQYNLRLALIGSFPIGLLASQVIQSQPESAITLSKSLPQVIVVDNPLVSSTTSNLTTTATSPAIVWGDPVLWIGLITTVLLSIGIGQLVKLFWSHYRIASFARRLNSHRLTDFSKPVKLLRKTRLAFSKETIIPFTFGWIRPTIVIPQTLKQNPEKVRMVIRHELMHIQRSDFLINSLVAVMKSLLWFHPLIHRIDNELKEYRELCCDADVLADSSVSSRQYARLLLELARKKKFSSPAIISMSVQQSKLKKRIKIMKNRPFNRLPAAVPVISSIVLLIFLSAVIGCSQLRSANQFPLVQSAGISWDDARISAFSSQPDDKLYTSPQQSSPNEQPNSGNPDQTPVSALNPARSENMENDRNDSGTSPLPKLTKDFQQCVRYPEAARKAGIEGLVILDFTVNEEGWAEDITVRRGVADFIDNEAKRCLDLSAFEPAIKNGQSVRAEVSLPVIFRLSGGDREQSYQAEVDSLLEEANLQNAINPIYVIGYGKVDNPSSNLPKVRLAPLNKSGNNE